MGEGRESPSEEVTFELRSEEGERADQEKKPATADAKALRQERKHHVLRTERGQSVWSLVIEGGGQ